MNLAPDSLVWYLGELGYIVDEGNLYRIVLDRIVSDRAYFRA